MSENGNGAASNGNGNGAHSNGNGYKVPAGRAEWIVKRKAEAARTGDCEYVARCTLRARG